MLAWLPEGAEVQCNEALIGSGSSAGPSAAQPEWQGSTDAIDKGLLMARDPILFYDEVPLYESELDDNGVASLSVKVRLVQHLHGPGGELPECCVCMQMLLSSACSTRTTICSVALKA